MYLYWIFRSSEHFVLKVSYCSHPLSGDRTGVRQQDIAIINIQKTDKRSQWDLYNSFFICHIFIIFNRRYDQYAIFIKKTKPDQGWRSKCRNNSGNLFEKLASNVTTCTTDNNFAPKWMNLRGKPAKTMKTQRTCNNSQFHVYAESFNWDSPHI